MPVQTQILTRRGTAASWTSTNPTLGAGEIGYETDTGRFKIGTGAAAWASLGYFNRDPLTTKGDLYTFSTTDDRLAVGNNGETLVADSSTSTGLRYQGSNAAGKNRIINGAMDFWQRATTFGPSGASGYFTADRWTVTLTANQMTWSQETSIVPRGFQYSMKATSTGGGGSWFQQFIESQNCQDLAGKTVTLSAYCATSGSQSVDFIVYSNATFNANSGSSGWSAVSTTVVSTTATMPTTPQSGQFVIPTDAKSLYVVIRSSGNLANGATMAITGVQLELGSVATAFSRAGGTLQGELAACQRYYQKSYAASIVPGASFPGGYSMTIVENNIPNTNYYHYQSLIVQTRVDPTITIYSASGATSRVSTTGGGDLAANSAVAALIADSHFAIQNSSGGALTASAGGFLFFYVASAEL